MEKRLVFKKVDNFFLAVQVNGKTEKLPSFHESATLSATTTVKLLRSTKSWFVDGIPFLTAEAAGTHLAARFKGLGVQAHDWTKLLRTIYTD